MNITKYKINDRTLPTEINLGIAGEYGVRRIVFDYSSLKKKYGDGRLEVFHKLPNRTLYFPVFTNNVGETEEWDVSATDTSAVGTGSVMLRYYVYGGLKKTFKIASLIAEDDSRTDEQAPSQVEEWVDKATEVLNSAEKAIENIPQTVYDALEEARESGKFKGDKPIKGLDYFTDEEMNQFADDVSEGARGDFKPYYDGKIKEFDDHAEEQKNAFDLNASAQHEAFESFASESVKEFDENAKIKTTQFNSNSITKTADFDKNANDKQRAYNQNAQSKVDEYNQNAKNKTDDFNDNYLEKVCLFDENSTTKTTEFNTTASQKKEEIEAIKTSVEADLEETKSQLSESILDIEKSLNSIGLYRDSEGFLCEKEGE